MFVGQRKGPGGVAGWRGEQLLAASVLGLGTEEVAVAAASAQHQGHQRWYFRKLMATCSLFQDLDSSGGIDSNMELIPQEELILRRN